MWQRGLKISSLRAQDNLVFPVGKWESNAEDIYKEKWRWLCNEAEEVLYQRNGNRWKKYELITRRGSSTCCRQFHQYRDIPQPADITDLRKNVCSKDRKILQYGRVL